MTIPAQVRRWFTPLFGQLWLELGFIVFDFTAGDILCDCAKRVKI
jgi:hypothetical protein